MSELTKINYFDLTLEVLKGRVKSVLGREEELDRLSRVLHRSIHNNALIIGPSGIGKTALVRGWAKRTVATQKNSPQTIIEFEAESFYVLGQTNNSVLTRYQEAFASLPACTIYIDDFGQLVHNKPNVLQNMARLLRPALENPQQQVIFSLGPAEYTWIQGELSSWLNFFEVINLKNQTDSEYLAILQETAKQFQNVPELRISPDSYSRILKLCQRFPSIGQLPAAAIRVLDEASAQAVLKNLPELRPEQIYTVVADKTGLPRSQLFEPNIQSLKNLATTLKQQIIGQDEAITIFTNHIQRARLGLKNPHRPLGSFLVLGPSGVGKTETAKVLAEQVFGKRENFFRFDMSEFGQAHTVQRLLGAPAGYVGYEAGGSLTNSVKAEPYSLILLDEIEKAHPKIFDIFLQILDDGRLTSGQGETVDFSQTIILATSNLSVAEIIAGAGQGQDIHSMTFRQTRLWPTLSQHFRTEFLNRFDDLIVYNPLNHEDLLKIAEQEIRKIEQRFESQHHLKFAIDPVLLMRNVQALADPKLGARPIKRFVEQTCESLISEALLQ